MYHNKIVSLKDFTNNIYDLLMIMINMHNFVNFNKLFKNLN